jgi:hypothetical protein
MAAPNPYAAPKTRVEDADDDNGADIDALPVSTRWKTKFKLIREAGGPRLPRMKELSVGDRLRAGFNLLAFLLGPFYYLAKGMWRKAITLFAVCAVAVIALAILLEFLGLGQLASSLGYGVAAVFAVRANIDYYKKMVLGDNGWW